MNYQERLSIDDVFNQIKSGNFNLEEFENWVEGREEAAAQGRQDSLLYFSN
jgi:hypothetical protein